MKAERSFEGLPIEELLRIRNTEATWPDAGTNVIFELFAAERGLAIPGA